MVSKRHERWSDRLTFHRYAECGSLSISRAGYRYHQMTPLLCSLELTSPCQDWLAVVKPVVHGVASQWQKFPRPGPSSTRGVARISRKFWSHRTTGSGAIFQSVAARQLWFRIWRAARLSSSERGKRESRHSGLPMNLLAATEFTVGPYMNSVSNGAHGT